MNSDLNESAAWRAFGMLEADEAASFDEAMRHDPELRRSYSEIDHLAAAVALASTTPIASEAGQLRKLQQRLGIHEPTKTNWFGISGWAAAAIITLVFLIQKTSSDEKSIVQNTNHIPPAAQGQAISKPKVPVQKETRTLAAVNHDPAQKSSEKTIATSSTRTLTRIQPRQLTQKIEILEEQVEVLQRREQQRLEVHPDIVWPVIVRMRPVQNKVSKKLDTAPVVTDQPSLTETISDALAAKEIDKDDNPDPLLADNAPEPNDPPPSIIAIYDPALNEGQVVATKIGPTSPGEELVLVANTDQGPVELGSFVSNGDASQSLSFSTPSSINLRGMSVLSVASTDGQPATFRVIYSSDTSSP